MSIEEKFDQAYSKIVDEYDNIMELSRKEAKVENRFNILILLVIVIINIGINIGLYKLMDSFSFEIMSLLITVSAAIFAAIKHRGGKSKIEKYANEFKAKVIAMMVKTFNEGFEFTPSEGLSQEIYDEGEFEKYDRYNSEDLIKGKMDNKCQFEMSEILTERESISDSSKKKYSMVFNGLLSRVETPKPFNSCLYLRKDIKDRNFLVRVLSGKYSFDKLRVEVEPKEFEKMFDIYTSNPEIVIKLFTTDIKQMLMKFQTEMKMEFEITMKNNYMYTRFWCGKMFEVAKLSKYSLDKETLYKYYKILVFIFELTDRFIEVLNKVECNK